MLVIGWEAIPLATGRSAGNIAPVSAEPTATAATVEESQEAERASDSPGAPRRLRRAGAVSLASNLLGHVLRLTSNLVLTRLLFEEAFGIMALVGVFLQGLELFSDIGLRAAIIQNPKGEQPEFLATAFTIQVGRGVLLSGVAALGAAPFASFYGMPLLASILPIAGLNAIINGLASTKEIVLERQLSIARIAILGVIAQVIGLIATVGWALHTPSVWALVFGSAVGALAKTLLTHVGLPGRRDRFGWQPEFAREILTFGRWIGVSTMLSFLANQSDRLILGKLLTTAQLGVYNIALVGASMPSAALGGLSHSVLFPVLSRAFEGGEDPSAECRRVREPILLLGGYLTSGIAGGATIVISLLYDARYESAGEMLRILGVGGYLSIVEVSAMYALLAGGASGWMAWSSAVKLVGTSVMIPVGYSLGGVHGALIGFVLADVAKYAVVMTGLRRVGVRVLSQDVKITALWTVAAGAALATTIMSEPLGGGFWELALRALLVAVVVTIVWAPTGLVYLRASRRERNSG